VVFKLNKGVRGRKKRKKPEYRQNSGLIVDVDVILKHRQVAGL